ncbi:hypothetical protein [Ancylobacter pratisalsi]|uniref:ABC transporter permease n=1 Tax=Ancylobacter pratisalsi TaxID=1745854 RepID=A0A6P1YRT1_9HYPH|nr:hypothetical protein [Ancylobacter pratisalsi]QIB34763.1 hypothetical protein G3A50_14390 [Ancylobacter pratisalsi]
MNLVALLTTTRIGQAILWVAGLVLAAWAIVAKLLAAGRAQERTRQTEQSLENLRDRQETNHEVDGLGDTALRGRLGRWVRKADRQ